MGSRIGGYPLLSRGHVVRIPVHPPCFPATILSTRLVLPSSGSARVAFPAFRGTITSSDALHVVRRRSF
jgi:hypothetical protein